MDKEMKNQIACTGKTVFAVIPNEDSDEYLDVAEVIADVKDIKDLNGVVIVEFADGTSEKAIVSPEDYYSFEQGVSICLTKKLISDLTYGNGSSIYNKLIKHCLKVYQRNREFERRMEELKADTERREAKEKERQRRKAARRKQREHDEMVSIFTESFKNAINELREESIREANGEC